MLNKRPWMWKRCRANQKQNYRWPKCLISRKAKKSKWCFSHNVFTDFVTWSPLQIKLTMIHKGGQVTKSIIGLKIHCEKNTILTSWPSLIPNIWLLTTLFLIGPTLLLHPGCFCLVLVFTYMTMICTDMYVFQIRVHQYITRLIGYRFISLFLVISILVNC